MSRSYNANGNDTINIYYEYCKDMQILTKKEEQELAQKMCQGNQEARKKLIEANIRLVIKKAKQMEEKTSLPLDDLVQHGIIGLIYAVDKFDPTLDLRFSTYATRCIFYKMFEGCVKDTRNIQLSKPMNDLVRQFKNIQTSLIQKLGYLPKIEEIAEIMNISLEDAMWVHHYTKDTVSLYFEKGEKEELSFEKFYHDNTTNVEKEYFRKEKIEWARKLLEISGLTEQERKVIIARYGFYNNDIQSLDTLGKIMGITNERIRQLEMQALRKMRIASIKYKVTSLQDDEEFAKKQLDLFQKKHYDQVYARRQNYLDRKMGKKNPKNSKHKTLYDIYEKYPKEIIEEGLLHLNPDHLLVLRNKFGEDFTKPPKTAEISKKTQNAFYNTVRTKFEEILKQLAQEKNQTKRLTR